MINSKQTEKTLSTEEALALAAQNAQYSNPPAPAIPAAVMAELDTYPIERLRELVRLCNAGQMQVAIMTEEQIKAAFLHRLAFEGIKHPEIDKALKAMKERLDRTEGTPLQTTETRNVNLTISVTEMQNLARERAKRLLARLAPQNSVETHLIENKPHI